MDDVSASYDRAAICEGVTLLAATGTRFSRQYPTTRCGTTSVPGGARERPADQIRGGENSPRAAPRSRRVRARALDPRCDLLSTRRVSLRSLAPDTGGRFATRDLPRTAALLGPPGTEPGGSASTRHLAAMSHRGRMLQVTAPSVEGSLGRSASRGSTAELIDLGLVHLMSSDTHGFSFRPYALRAACSALRDRELADQLRRESESRGPRAGGQRASHGPSAAETGPQAVGNAQTTMVTGACVEGSRGSLLEEH